MGAGSTHLAGSLLDLEKGPESASQRIAPGSLSHLSFEEQYAIVSLRSLTPETVVLHVLYLFIYLLSIYYISKYFICSDSGTSGSLICL